MSSQYTAGIYKAWTDAGVPAVGYRLYTYTNGTTTHKNAYTTAAFSTPVTYTSDGGGGQYLALNSRGEANLWLNGLYTIVLKTAAGVTVLTSNDQGDGSTISAAMSPVVTAATLAAGRTALGASTSGDTVFTGTSAQGRTALGSTTVGDALFITASASAARATLGVSDDSLVAHLANPETFTGVKTFSVQPVLPQKLTSGTKVNASGTSVDFTGIPSWAVRITVMVSGLSTNGTSTPMIQLGDSGGVETSGYLSSAVTVGNTASNGTAGFLLAGGVDASSLLGGAFVLTLIDAATFTWTLTGMAGFSNAAAVAVSAGSKSTSAALDRIRVTTVGGADTFDAGSINILYE